MKRRNRKLKNGVRNQISSQPQKMGTSSILNIIGKFMLTNKYHEVMPKNLFYLSDGSGRDTYIAYDNGGCFCPSLKCAGNKRGFTRPVSAASHYQPKSQHYVADGTGRDGYVKVGDGGLHSIARVGGHAEAYKQGLRGYAKLRSPDPFTRVSSSWALQRGRRELRLKSQLVSNCIKRLYVQTKAKARP